MTWSNGELTMIVTVWFLHSTLVERIDIQVLEKEGKTQMYTHVYIYKCAS